MNIIFFIGTMRGGGAEGVVATLTTELANKGHKISLVSHFGQQAYIVGNNVNIIDVRKWRYDTFVGTYPVRIYKKVANRFLDLYHIYKLIKQEKPDVVISFLVNFMWQIILTCKWRIPIISAERNAMIYPHSGNNFYNKHILYRIADVVQVMSKHDKAWVRNRYKKVIYMPNPLRFIPISEERYDQTFAKRKNILACGRINPQKGYDKLIMAFAKISNDYPDWDIDISGAVMDDDIYSRHLSYLINKYGLSKRIHFIGFHKDIDKVMQNHSIFCLSSQHEGFPNVLSEAMANGLACISFDIVTGPSEIINDGIDGMIVEDQNIDALADGLSKLISNIDLRYSYGKHAIVNIKRFDKDRIVEKWEQMFKSVIKMK